MRTVAVIVCAALRVATAHAGTNSDAAARRACETAVRTKVRTDYPACGRVELQSDSAHRQGTDKQVAIRGSGRVETRDGGLRRLTFNCIYNLREGAVSSARYDIAKAGGGSQTGATPAYVCKRAVAKRIHDSHPASGKIRWLVSSIAERRVSNQQTAVTGAGRIQTQYGDWRKFTFSCTYDHRTGRASRAGATF
jgi:hypothetical protein